MVTAFAPGRVNLVGEHTDYTGGLALPFAIERGVTVRATPLAEPRVEVVARDLGETDAFALDAIGAVDGWRAYVRGVCAEVGVHDGARLEISANLPQGAGLSSSAALCIAAALSLGAAGLAPASGSLAPASPTRAVAPSVLALARACARVEHRWAGAETGLLDQLAILLAHPGHAVRLDFRDLSARDVPLDLRGWTLALADSGAQHSNAASGYNTRRAECEQARALLRLEWLRDASPEAAAELPEPLAARVRHVASENARVDEAVAALEAGELAAVADVLDRSHASLRDDHDVSVPEVERTRDALLAAGARGARIVGGGFGGSVLALFPPGMPPPDETITVTPAAPARTTKGSDPFM